MLRLKQYIVDEMNGVRTRSQVIQIYEVKVLALAEREHFLVACQVLAVSIRHSLYYTLLFFHFHLYANKASRFLLSQGQPSRPAPDAFLCILYWPPACRQALESWRRSVRLIPSLSQTSAFSCTGSL